MSDIAGNRNRNQIEAADAAVGRIERDPAGDVIGKLSHPGIANMGSPAGYCMACIGQFSRLGRVAE
jgi:hypothetical protein